MIVPSDPSKPWYTKQRVGTNIIKGMVQKSLKTGLQDKYSNYSFLATSTTRMFDWYYKESKKLKNY